MSGYFINIGAGATFDAAGATKLDLYGGEHLFVGLNCFEPGQSQRVHAHRGADKFYVVVSGKARMAVGDEVRTAEAGTLVVAPADVPHGVVEALERTVMLVAIAPAPAGSGNGGTAGAGGSRGLSGGGSPP